MGRCCTSPLFTAAWLLPVAAAWAASDDDVFRYRPTPTLSAAAAQGDLEALRDLLTKGEDPNAQDEQGCTPLSYACREGQPDAARLLIEAGAPVGEECGLGEFPINLAAHSGNVGLVKLLLERGADIEQPGRCGGRPLNDAACSGSLRVVKYLLAQGVEIDAYDSYFRSALSHACLFDRPDVRKYQVVVRTLLDAGANANLGAGEFDTPITYALMQSSPSTLELLLNHGADPNVKNSWGLTPLHFAGKYRNRAAVPILLAHGARVEDIYQSAAADNVAIASKLLREGVNVKVKDWQGETPLDWAVGMGSARVAALLVSRPEQSGVTDEQAQAAIVTAAGAPESALVKALLQACQDREGLVAPTAAVFVAIRGDNVEALEALAGSGIRVTEVDRSGHGALQDAAWQGSFLCMEFLLAQGADVNRLDACGGSAILEAAHYFRADAVEILLKAGADAKIRDAELRTPLHLVCIRGTSSVDENLEQLRAARLLVEAGSDVSALDRSGYNPLDYALPIGWCGTGKNFELIDYLKDHGAKSTEAWQAAYGPRTWIDPSFWTGELSDAPSTIGERLDVYSGLDPNQTSAQTASEIRTSPKDSPVGK